MKFNPMKNYIPILIFFLCVTNIYAQQSSSIDFFDNGEFDKVTISYFSIFDRTSSPTPPTKLVPLDSLEKTSNTEFNENGNEKTKILGEAELTKKEIKELTKILQKKTIPIYSMDSNTNIVINFYRNNSVIQNITISPNTKNLSVSKQNCKNVQEEDGNIYNPCLYLGQMTKEFENYINCLIKKKKLLN